MKYKILLASGFFLLVLTGYMLWAKPFSYKPSPEALEIIGKSQSVQKIDLGWDGTYYVFFPDRSKGQRKGFILYPGGLVDARAYAPMMQSIAAEGYLAIIVSMPFDLAVLGSTRAGILMSRYPEIEKWALGGHSLGGVMACRYARVGTGNVSGVVLWASYPSKAFSLADTSIKVLSIYGTYDGLSTVDKIESSKKDLPQDTRFVEIKRGNHTQFGCYGDNDHVQRGDKSAGISRDLQQQHIIQATADFLGGL